MIRLGFLGSMGRSGTNLLRSMLDCHPEIASGPEFNYLQDIINVYRSLYHGIETGQIRDYLETSKLDHLMSHFMRELFSGYGEKKNSKLVIEKTPSNLWTFSELAHLFPDAKFIHLIRDGRDVACSHREVGERFAAKGFSLDAKDEASLVSIFHCGALWSETVRFGMTLCSPDSVLARGGRIITVRYEDLVQEPRRELECVCEHLGVPFFEGMLDPERFAHDTFVDGIWVQDHESKKPVSRESVGQWKQKMSMKDRVLFAAKGQTGLIAAGYAQTISWTLEDIGVPPDAAAREIAEARELVERYSAENS